MPQACVFHLFSFVIFFLFQNGSYDRSTLCCDFKLHFLLASLQPDRWGSSPPPSFRISSLGVCNIEFGYFGQPPFGLGKGKCELFMDGKDWRKKKGIQIFQKKKNSGAHSRHGCPKYLKYIKYLIPQKTQYLILEVLDTLFFFLVLFYLFSLCQVLFLQKKRQVLDQVQKKWVLDQVLERFFSKTST